MGAVYKAEDLRLEGRVCAVKEVHPEPGISPTALTQAQEQFRREASTLARLDHPNLPKVSDYFSQDGQDYLVMDFVAGRNLKEIVDEAHRKGQFLSEQQVLAWARQIIDALEYLHQQKPLVLHRDIKPANIKLMPQGRIKLVDFGLVKHLDLEDPRTITVMRGLGSLHYVPLEQYAGDLGHTDVRSDIYSLGATLYHLLTGQPPATAQERFLHPDALVRPRTLNPRLSLRTEKAILWAMAMHPDERPSCVAQFREELFSTSQGPGYLPTGAPTARARWGEAIRENAGLIALVFILLLLAILMTLRPPAPLPIAGGGASPTIIATPVP